MSTLNLTDDAQLIAVLSRRYADILEEAKRLRTQVAALQTERDRYSDLYNELHNQSSSSTRPAGQDAQTLFRAETVLERAKEEYTRLKDDVKEAQDSVRSLEEEIGRLHAKLEAAHAEGRARADSLSTVHQTRKMLEERCSTLESEVKVALQLARAREDRPHEYVRDGEIASLQASLAKEQAKNAELQRELSLLKGKSIDQKTKAILTSVTTSLQAATTTLHRRTESQSVPNLKRASSRASSLRPQADLQANSSTAALSTPSYVTPMPGHRVADLKRLDPHKWTGAIPSTKVAFSRKALALHIGGGSQSLIANVKTKKHLAEKRGIDTFLCPNLEQNPWVPTIPGEHGYMFVGLGEERNTFRKEEVCSLFVGIQSEKKSDRQHFRYLGIYMAKRVDPLELSEWNTLAPQVQFIYSATSLRKDPKLGETEADVRKKYDAGLIKVPCVRLQCINFDNYVLEYLTKTRLTSRASISTMPSTMTAKRPQEVHEEGGRHRKMKSTS